MFRLIGLILTYFVALNVQFLMIQCLISKKCYLFLKIFFNTKFLILIYVSNFEIFVFINQELIQNHS